MAMNENDFVYKELEHIRMIHFSLIAISVTIISLILSSWNDAPEIYSDLLRLRQLANILSQSEINSSQLVEYSSLITNIDTRPTLSFTGNGRPLLNTRTLDLDRRSRIIPDREFHSSHELGAVIHSIIDNQWSMQVITGIDVSNTLSQECQTAISSLEHREASHVESHGTYKQNYWNSVDAIDYRRDSIAFSVIRIRQVGWSASNESTESQATLDLELRLNGFDVSRVRGDDGKMHWGRSPYDDRADCATVANISILNVPLNSDFRAWYEHNLPTVKKNISKLSNLTIDQILDWQKTERLSGIAQQRPSFLGLSFGGQGGFIIAAGLASMFVCFVYVIIYLSQLNRYIGTKQMPGFLSPWIVIRPGHWSQGIAIATLILLPTISLILTFWRIFGTSWLTLLLAALGFLSLGIIAHYRSVKVLTKLGDQKLS